MQQICKPTERYKCRSVNGVSYTATKKNNLGGKIPLDKTNALAFVGAVYYFEQIFQEVFRCLLLDEKYILLKSLII